MNNRKLLCLTSFGIFALTASLYGVAPEVRNLAEGMGSLTGHVTRSDDSLATGCVVKFLAPPDYSGTGGTGGGAKGKAAGWGVDLGLPLPHFLQGKGRVMAQAVVDDKGNFEIKQMKAGTYRFLAGTPKAGLGSGTVTIEEGKAATVQIKLAAPR